MNWFKKNWVWLLLGVAVLVVGYEAMMSISNAAGKTAATSWFNKLKFWDVSNSNTTGPQAAGSGGTKTESAADVPSSAAVAQVIQ